jgi:hypothetical protein
MILILALVVGALLGLGMAINGKTKRRDKRDANRYLAEQGRAQRAAKKQARR